jgi:hypothetical protein
MNSWLTLAGLVVSTAGTLILLWSSRQRLVAARPPFKKALEQRRLHNSGAAGRTVIQDGYTEWHAWVDAVLFPWGAALVAIGFILQALALLP